MTPQCSLRQLERVLTFVVLLLAAPRASFSQAAAPGPVDLAPEVRARVAQAAEDSGLAPWQRGIMLGLARTGKTSALDATAADPRAARPAQASGAADGTWDQLVVPGMWGQSAIYDPVRDRVVVFGGFNSPGTAAMLGPPTNDVWALSLSGTPAWTQLTPLGTPPSARYSHSAIYDPVRDRMVVYGGTNSVDGGPPQQAFSDVEALSLAGTPTWLDLYGNTNGPPIDGRSGQSAIYDPVRDRMVVFGGEVPVRPPYGNYLVPSYPNEVAALSLSGTPSWERLATAGTPPSGREGHGAIYDPVSDRMVIFGGGYQGTDLWALSLAGTPAWTQMSPSGTPPGWWTSVNAIYDPIRESMVVLDTGSGLSYDLALTGPPAWTPLTISGTTPSGRGGFGAVYDPVRDRIVVCGGAYGDSNYVVTMFNEAWSLSLAGAPTWTQLTFPGPLAAARREHSAIYDPVRDRMVVFGGSGTSPRSGLDDVWALSLAGAPGWTQLTPTGTPPVGRLGHSSIYDPVRDRMVVFGGRSGSLLNDVWALSLAGTPGWTQLTPSGTPPAARSHQTVTYDPVRDRMLVFAGDSSRYAPGMESTLNDVWALSLGGMPAWTQLTPLGTPPTTRSHHSAIYDPVRDRMVVFGGYDGFSVLDLNDVWALSLADTPAWTQLAPSGTPPIERSDHSAIYNPAHDRMVVYGGSGYSGYTDDVWALVLAGTPAWTRLAPSGTPPLGRSGHSAIYDLARDRMVVFGGGVVFNDVWSLSWESFPTPVQLSLVSADVTADGVKLTWSMGGSGSAVATVYRSMQGGWTPIGEVSPDGTGYLRYTDPIDAAATRVGYRLGIVEAGIESFYGETWVDLSSRAGNVPLAFALERVRPNPSRGSALTVRFTLPTGAPARLELLDLAGRRIVSREVGAGRQALDLGAGLHLAPGLYLVRLTQGANTRTTRVAVLP